MPIMLRLHSMQNKNGPSPRFTAFCVAVQPARKQKRSMTLSRRHTRHVVAALLGAPALLAAFLGGVSAARAGDAVTQSPWSVGENSQARLLAAGGPEPGANIAYRAGIEIELKPGAH